MWAAKRDGRPAEYSWRPVEYRWLPPELMALGNPIPCSFCTTPQNLADTRC